MTKVSYTHDLSWIPSKTGRSSCRLKREEYEPHRITWKEEKNPAVSNKGHPSRTNLEADLEQEAQQRHMNGGQRIMVARVLDVVNRWINQTPFMICVKIV